MQTPVNTETPMVTYLDPRLSSHTNLNFSIARPPGAPPNPLEIRDGEDRMMIDNWLLERGKFQMLPYHKLGPKQCDFSPSIARTSLKNSLEILEKLQTIQDELKINVQTMSTSEWKQKTLDIGLMRTDFEKLMLPFEDQQNLTSLKSVVKKRSKKRSKRRQVKENQRENQGNKLKKRVEINKNIDKWLENQNMKVSEVKQEEKTRKDADCILYEVTRKKSDARKQLSLISALVKLRNVRDNIAVHNEGKVSLEDRRAFGTITEKLINLWENTYQKYTKEEQNLRKLLEVNAEIGLKTEKSTEEEAIFECWQKWLFDNGTKAVNLNTNPTYWALTSAERDLETFVAIRKSWDTFLTNPGNSKGSHIPIGWVLPPEKPSEKWVHFLEI